MKTITTIKNYRSNIDVFFEEEGISQSMSFVSNDYWDRDEPVTFNETRSELKGLGFDDESIEKILLEMSINDWVQNEKHVSFDGHSVKVVEWNHRYYIDFTDGFGYGCYPMDGWTLEAALEDYAKTKNA